MPWNYWVFAQDYWNCFPSYFKQMNINSNNMSAPEKRTCIYRQIFITCLGTFNCSQLLSIIAWYNRNLKSNSHLIANHSFVLFLVCVSVFLSYITVIFPGRFQGKIPGSAKIINIRSAKYWGLGAKLIGGALSDDQFLWCTYDQ